MRKIVYLFVGTILTYFLCGIGYTLLQEKEAYDLLQEKETYSPWNSSFDTKNCTPRSPLFNPYTHSTTCPSIRWHNTENIKFSNLSHEYPYSSVNCTNSRLCIYRNVCLQGGRMNFYRDPDSTMNHPGQWYHYQILVNAAGKNVREAQITFAPHTPLSVFSSPRPSDVNWKYLPETVLWFDNSHGLGHPGHATETIFTSVEFRLLRPSIHLSHIVMTGLGYTNDEFSCNLLRGLFDDWEIPPLVNRDLLNEVCFKEVFVQPGSRIGFHTHAGAEFYVKNIWKMCSIRERKKRAVPSKFLLYQRGFNRRIRGGELLCNNIVSQYGMLAIQEVFEDVPFCNRIKTLYDADVILSPFGTHLFLSMFSHPSAVILQANPWRTRSVDSKHFAYFTKRKFYEFVCGSADCEYEYVPLVPAPPHPIWMGFHGWTESQKPSEIPLHWERLKMFIDGAIATWDKEYVALPCQEPINVDDSLAVPPSPVFSGPNHFFSYNFANEMNYAICEPPAPYCWCCKYKECQEFQTWALSKNYNLNPLESYASSLG